MTARRIGWVLSQESLEKLLLVLDSDRDRAAQKYEAIRVRLIRLFEWRGCTSPEALADRTIDRVARRIDEGEQIRAGDPALYFCGVARNVLKEYWTSIQKERKLRESGPPLSEVTKEEEERENGEQSKRLECLDRCLANLPFESLDLIIRYYQSERHDRIASRAALAQELGITLGTLRIRAHRIRRALEEEVNECMKQ